MRFAILALTSAAGLLSACASSVSTRYELDQSASSALVVIGVKSETIGYGGYSVVFERLNPETCQPDPWGLPRIFDQRGIFDAKAYAGAYKERHYIVATFDPGAWVITSMGTPTFENIRFDGRTLAFTAEAGGFIYLGDITFDGHNIKFDGYNRDALQAHLANYPNIKRSPQDHPRWFTPVRRGGPVKDCQTSRLPKTELTMLRD